MQKVLSCAGGFGWYEDSMLPELTSQRQGGHLSIIYQNSDTRARTRRATPQAASQNDLEIMRSQQVKPDCGATIKAHHHRAVELLIDSVR
jgi:hypothetical protein